MLPGYNTDIQYQGSTYHIQTEDNGESNPSIVTLVYQGGAILARRKTDYRHLLGKPRFREEVRRVMHDQHRETIKKIMDGKLDSLQSSEEQPEPKSAPSPAPAPLPSLPSSLDEEIMHFLAEMGD